MMFDETTPDSDLMPNAGEYFQPMEPPERTRKRDVARGKAKASKDTILEVVKRLEARIAFYDSMKSIPASSLASDTDTRMTIMANKQTVANLEQELGYWKGVLKRAN